MDKKLIPTQDALADYSSLVEGLKKEPRRKQSKELRNIYVYRINKGLIYAKADIYIYIRI